MRAARWPAVIAVVFGLGPSLQAQQGQGAAASAPEAMLLLRAGLLSRPGELVEFLSTLPPTFPKELLPEGVTVEIASTSASITVVVSRVKAGTAFNVGEFGWKLQQSGWISNEPTPAGFAMPGATGGPLVAICKSGQFVSDAGPTRGERRSAPAHRGCRRIGSVVRAEWRRGIQRHPDAKVRAPGRRRQQGGGGGGGSNSESYQSAQLTTSMPSDALAKAFTDQLVAEGWKLEGQPVSDGTMTVERLTANIARRAIH